MRRILHFIPYSIPNPHHIEETLEVNVEWDGETKKKAYLYKEDVKCKKYLTQ